MENVPVHFEYFLRRFYSTLYHLSPETIDPKNIQVAVITPPSPSGRLTSRVLLCSLTEQGETRFSRNEPLQGSSYQHLPFFTNWPNRETMPSGSACVIQLEETDYLIRPYGLLYEQTIFLVYPFKDRQDVEDVVRTHQDVLWQIGLEGLENSLFDAFDLKRLAELSSLSALYDAFSEALAKLLLPFTYQLRINGRDEQPRPLWREPFRTGGAMLEISLASGHDEAWLLMDFATLTPDGECFAWDYSPERLHAKKQRLQQKVRQIFAVLLKLWTSVRDLPLSQQVYELIAGDIEQIKQKIVQVEQRLREIKATETKPGGSPTKGHLYAIFTDEVNRWHITFDGKTYATRASPTGLWYLRRLLLHPSETVNTHELNSYYIQDRAEKDIAQIGLEADKKKQLEKLFDMLRERKARVQDLFKAKPSNKEGLRRDLVKQLDIWRALEKKGIGVAAEQVEEIRFLLSKLPPEHAEFSVDIEHDFSAYAESEKKGDAEYQLSYRKINNRVDKNMDNALKALKNKENTHPIWEYLDSTIQRNTDPGLWEYTYRPEYARFDERRDITWEDHV